MALGRACATPDCSNEAAVDRTTCGSCRWARRNGRQPEPTMRLSRIGERYDAEGNFKGSYHSFARPMVEPLRPAAPVKVQVKLPKPQPKAGKTVAFLPDAQIGYRRLDDGTLEAFHDEDAMAASLRVLAAVRPDVVVNLGDLVDFAPLSRFAQEPGFSQTTQAAVDRAHRFLAECIAVTPGAEHHLIAGNHDVRAERWMAKHAPELARVRPTGSAWPAVSVPAFLRLDDLGVHYVDSYPAGRLWLGEDLVVQHGVKVNSSGSTAALYVKEATTCVVYGHVHRHEFHPRTYETAAGLRTVWAASPGTLAKNRGGVPSFHGSTSGRTGAATELAENWTQGVGVVTLLDGVPPLWEHAFIVDGQVFFRGAAL